MIKKAMTYLLGKFMFIKYTYIIHNNLWMFKFYIKYISFYRFRHLATKMHFKSKNKSSSPEHLAPEENKSRRNSPVFPRKLSYVQTENDINTQKQ